ncbi:hypothetical protein BDZ94DRAFT_1241422 [Collybia nuda]|uniref:Uncharacterized protein n=1 Tax=Collybia nuda TaxID=64659 RepID=A0A9P5XTJ2_9AGAR|nr:hypothetical protein BDZ94DRAFT_1241422 [Collybia nuda]
MSTPDDLAKFAKVQESIMASLNRWVADLSTNSQETADTCGEGLARARTNLYTLRGSGVDLDSCFLDLYKHFDQFVELWLQPNWREWGSGYEQDLDAQAVRDCEKDVEKQKGPGQHGDGMTQARIAPWPAKSNLAKREQSRITVVDTKANARQAALVKKKAEEKKHVEEKKRAEEKRAEKKREEKAPEESMGKGWKEIGEQASPVTARTRRTRRRIITRPVIKESDKELAGTPSPSPRKSVPKTPLGEKGGLPALSQEKSRAMTPTAVQSSSSLGSMPPLIMKPCHQLSMERRTKRKRVGTEEGDVEGVKKARTAAAEENWHKYLKAHQTDGDIENSSPCEHCSKAVYPSCIRPAAGKHCWFCVMQKQRCSLDIKGDEELAPAKRSIKTAVGVRVVKTAKMPDATISGVHGEVLESESEDEVVIVQEVVKGAVVKDKGKQKEAEQNEPTVTPNFPPHNSPLIRPRSQPDVLCWAPARPAQPNGVIPPQYTSVLDLNNRTGTQVHQILAVRQEILRLEASMDLSYTMLRFAHEALHALENEGVTSEM